MPRLCLEVPHALGQEEALRRLREKLDSARDAYQTHVHDLTQQWSENQLSFAFQAVGMKVSGTVAVEPDKVTVDAQLPLAAMVLKGAIAERVRQEIGNILT